ncbi:ribosomal protein L12 [Babesia caballi]|uniref:Ribosomal protein L12 n=1 Tax=Babesia caballi TaxID=5871 RepID=A0AAV4LPJ0_BABCB|nr:ribosomal protein L12 [Babesia caballi]
MSSLSDPDSSSDVSQNASAGHTAGRPTLAYSTSGLLTALVCTLLYAAVPVQGLRPPRWRQPTASWTFIGSRQQLKPPWGGTGTSYVLRASKVDDILEELKTLTLLETSELVKKIEETFGVSASMAVSAAPAAAGAPAMASAPEDEEDDEDKPKKTSFEVVLLERPEEQSVRMALFRVLRKVLPDKPLTEVKAAIDNAPTTLKVVPKEEEAKEAVKLIEGAGGKVEVR